jgi:hypothetical protein
MCGCECGKRNVKMDLCSSLLSFDLACECVRDLSEAEIFRFQLHHSFVCVRAWPYVMSNACTWLTWEMAGDGEWVRVYTERSAQPTSCYDTRARQRDCDAMRCRSTRSGRSFLDRDLNNNKKGFRNSRICVNAGLTRKEPTNIKRTRWGINPHMPC